MAARNTKLPFSSAHFIGIGGAGMSGIALVLHERGCAVSGSDLKSSRYVRQLEADGIEVIVGHEAKTIDRIRPDVVVISSAIPESNPELKRAHELGIEVWQRAQMLSALSQSQTTIAVAGTHGKTTTSSIVATMLDHMGCDPSFLIGGIVEGYETNGKNGFGEYFVCETDESDGSFLFLTPNVVVVTNIEADHLDHYESLEEIEDTFVEFMASVGEDGTVIVNGDSPRLVELAGRSGAHVVTYGLAKTCDYVCKPKKRRKPSVESQFLVTTPKGRTEELTLTSNPGVHNMVNATAAIAVAEALGLKSSAAAEAVSSFAGVRRRFTKIGEVSGVSVVDDYGHHPTEITATLKAASELGFSRTVVVFQPHRYSRTAALMDDFAHAFKDADVLYVLDVFSAGEMPIPGATGKTVANRVRKTGEVDSVSYVSKRKLVLEYLASELHSGDLLITLGAGDVTTIGPDVIELLLERESAASEGASKDGE